MMYRGRRPTADIQPDPAVSEEAGIEQLTEAFQSLREQLAEGGGGPTGGGGADHSSLLRIVLGVAISAALAAHAFLWQLNATVARVEETLIRIESNQRDMHAELDAHVAIPCHDVMCERVENLTERVGVLERPGSDDGR